MRTQATENEHRAGFGRAVKEVTERASSIVRLELQLASLELKRKIASLGVGIGLGVGALVFAVFGLGFLFATIAAALATFLATWLALLIVTVFLLLVGAILGLLSLRSIKRGTPPVPKQAIQEAKLTTSALKGGNGHHD
jgi:tetrahydromethanopterin S-methyltransferase subunit C